MKLDVFVYIPSVQVMELVYGILAKKGWHWYGTSDSYGFKPAVPFFIYMIESQKPYLGYCNNPYTDNGRYTEIGINEFISEWEEDHGTDQERRSPNSETARI